MNSHGSHRRTRLREAQGHVGAHVYLKKVLQEQGSAVKP